MQHCLDFSMVLGRREAGVGDALVRDEVRQGGRPVGEGTATHGI